MAEAKLKKVKNREGKDVEILDQEVEEGKPTGADNWRVKLIDRKLMLKYLETGERYWYSDDWYGSEKRKNPA
jgi:hypothetical protein